MLAYGKPLALRRTRRDIHARRAYLAALVISAIIWFAIQTQRLRQRHAEFLPLLHGVNIRRHVNAHVHVKSMALAYQA